MPLPQIHDGEALLKVEASGICGSDVMEWYRIKKAPLVLGHEVAGTIEAVGKGVKDLRKGDRVTVAHHVPCNACRYCLAGNHSVCDTLRKTNLDPGGFAEFARVPAINVERGVLRLPDSMSFEEGSFSEPLGCVVRGFRVSGFGPGKTVLVAGSGISGALHIKLARALGAGAIFATDINDFRLDMAKGFGADYTINGKHNIPSIIKERNNGRLADFVAICTAADRAIEQALSSVERGGTVLFFAPKEQGQTCPMPLFDLWRDNITITNTYASCHIDTEIDLGLIERERVRVSDMVTHRLTLDQTRLGFSLVAGAGESLKVIIEPNRKG
ncbi:MAG: alcohol dehydrogenase catalytic domain-containing protein [Deltaproteobacteria bacterium]|nr:alcohol dehydrogenase catalytic domain-containing protein [Deltaproteobacteria bacterium]